MKKVWRILSIVVAIVLALGMTTFAEGEKKAAYTIGSVTEANVGDIISIPVTLETSADLNSIALNGFKYNKRILKFVGYTENESINELALFKTWMEDPMIISIGLKDPMKFEGDNSKLCVLKFQILKPGETTVSATVVAKNNSDVFETSLVKGNVLAAGEVEPETIYDYENVELDNVSLRKEDVVALKINAATAYAYGKTAMIDPDNSKVVPYLKNDRTLVPLRFVSETLGAEVQWENGWNYCYVVKGDKKIKITFNSADIEVNGEVVTYDAPVEVVQDRTMVPIRFISEQLGYDVKWNQANQLVIITPATNPWNADGRAEKDVLEGILVTFLFNGIF